jgi:hypothetical protein
VCGESVAYLGYCRRMDEFFKPAYLAIGIKVTLNGWKCRFSEKKLPTR